MHDPLATYLHDHLAGSRFAVELLEKLASEFENTPTGEIARELHQQVETDRGTLQQIIDKTGESSKDFYDALGWIAERGSRMKLDSDDPAGLGVFEAFDALSLGILGKRSLWQALQVAQATDPRLAGLDYDALMDRADQQYQTANQYRLQIVGRALHPEAHSLQDWEERAIS